MSFNKIFLMMLFVVPLTTLGQSKIKPKDSVDIKKQIEGFYSWYIDIIKTRKVEKDFNPSFIRCKDGMTTLDFTNYRDGLRRYKFTETYIERKIKDYKECVDNLKKVPFDKFSEYSDLDDFEGIMCDFSNRYEWTGGQEPKDKAELINLKLVNSNTIVGQVRFTSYGSQDGTGARVTFKKSKKDWKVDNIELNRI
jgi:hypothetical protein